MFTALRTARVSFAHVGARSRAACFHLSAATSDNRKNNNSLPDLIEKWDRKSFYKVGGVGLFGAAGALAHYGVNIETGLLAALVGAYWGVGIRDINQTSHGI